MKKKAQEAVLRQEQEEKEEQERLLKEQKEKEEAEKASLFQVTEGPKKHRKLTLSERAEAKLVADEQKKNDPSQQEAAASVKEALMGNKEFAQIDETRMNLILNNQNLN